MRCRDDRPLAERQAHCPAAPAIALPHARCGKANARIVVVRAYPRQPDARPWDTRMIMVFWAALVLVGFAYAGYPVVMLIRARWHPLPVRSAADRKSTRLNSSH